VLALITSRMPMKESNFDKQAIKVFKALGDINRYNIMKLLLARGELSCADFDGKFPLTKPAMSHHYRILENAGLINVRKKGLHFYMSANTELIKKFVPNLIKTHIKH
jgi:ArsR family transcriptional regulator